MLKDIVCVSERALFIILLIIMQLPDSIQQNKRATISHDTTSPCRTSSASAPALIEWRRQQKYESGTEISQEMQKKSYLHYKTTSGHLRWDFEEAHLK